MLKTVLARAEIPFATRRAFLWFIALYAIAQVLLRIAVSPSLGRDDLIEAIIAQGWQLGYNPTQPPLYTWLIVAVSEVIGYGVPAHSLVKFGCLYLAYRYFFLAAEKAIGDSYWAALATATWMLTYMFGWDVTQNYTQSVVLLAICSALLYVALCMREELRWNHYVVLGVLLGLGTLSKYGFPVFALSLFAVGLFDRQMRRAILDWRMILSILIAVLLFAPHLFWVVFGPKLLRGAFTGALQVGWKGGYWQGVGAGLVSILRSSFDFLAPAIVVWALLFWRAFTRRIPATDAARATRRLFDRWLILSYAILVGGVVFGGASNIKYHYMVVVLLPAPIWLFLRWRDLDPPAWPGRAFALATLVAVAAVFIAVAVRGFGPPRCGKCYLHWDYAAVAAELRKAGFQSGTILADDHHVGGNLRTYFPDSRLFTLKFEQFVPPRRRVSPGQCLIIWDATLEGAEMPEDLMGFARISLGAHPDDAGQPMLIELPFRNSSKRFLKLGYVLFPKGSGGCS